LKLELALTLSLVLPAALKFIKGMRFALKFMNGMRLRCYMCMYCRTAEQSLKFRAMTTKG